MKLRNTVLFGAAVAMAAMIQTAQASLSTASLAYLASTPGATLSIGDKTFSGFTYLPTTLSGFDANQIQVTASQAGGNYYLTWGGTIALVSGGPAIADLLLGYTVTANAGKIFYIDQNYTGSAQPAGGAILAVDETAYVPGNATVVGYSHLQVGDLSDPWAEPGDILQIIPPASTLNITKDIRFGITAANGGFVTISQIEQSFEQVQVPESPTVIAGALLLLPFAASTFRILRRKRMA